MAKNKKQNTKKQNTNKQNTVVKEKDIIKESDFEGSMSDSKKVIIITLVLALLIGGFAFVRNLEKKNDEPNVEEPSNDEEEPEVPVVEEKPTVNENQANNWNNYQPVEKPKEEVKEEVIINVWEDLEDIPETLEAGSEYLLPEIKVDDNNSELIAVLTYKFKSNEEDSEYTTVTEFDKNMIGTYLITYTLNYEGGKVENKEVEIQIVDTTEPIVNGINNGDYLNKDVTLSITEYSPYIVKLNDEVYDETKPIDVEGVYTLEVIEDIPDGKSIKIEFTLDKTLPEITGIEKDAYYNAEEAKIVSASDTNLDKVVVTHNGEEVEFENGITEFILEGEYVVTATDLAGNSLSYTFTIDRVAPTLEVTYTPDLNEMTKNPVIVTVTANEKIQVVTGWELSEDGLSISKEFTTNAKENLKIYDLANNMSEISVEVNNIYTVEFSPKLTLENLVANKVKATIISLKQLTLNEEWIEVIEGDLYKYEKIYDESGIEIVDYIDSDNNIGTIEVNVEISLDEAFVEYVEDEQTQDVTVYVTTEEEVLEENLPEGWTLELPVVTIDELENEEPTTYKYYKKYTENVAYELVEFITENKHYAVTIVIDSIDRDAPIAEVEITYNTNEETNEKESVVITITSNEEIQEVENWEPSEDGKTITQIIERPEGEVPTEDQNGSVTIKDIKNNETVVDYTYNWN